MEEPEALLAKVGTLMPGEGYPGFSVLCRPVREDGWGAVDDGDLTAFVTQWLEKTDSSPIRLDTDQRIDFKDFALLATDGDR